MDEPRKPAEVINLWVRRQERARAAEESQEIWTCGFCGSRVFNWYRVSGLRCWHCEKPTVPPR